MGNSTPYTIQYLHYLQSPRRFSRFKPHTDTDLVFLKHSPDYCEFDISRGSLGTHGRECNPVRKKKTVV